MKESWSSTKIVYCVIRGLEQVSTIGKDKKKTMKNKEEEKKKVLLNLCVIKGVPSNYMLRTNIHGNSVNVFVNSNISVFLIHYFALKL